ncbi:hypothetical protein ACFTSF_28895 [Kribbella sp. NPDC056951]|uniref:hypothetical protein n=1 Tax=Kribbella sp. NPDC056951 TaxID=3345978 RepID=UPI00362883ED
MSELTCWYCGRRPAVPAVVHYVPLKRDEKELPLIVATVTTGQVVEVTVPRCRPCWWSNLVYYAFMKLRQFALGILVIMLVADIWITIDRRSSGCVRAAARTNTRRSRSC